MIMQDVIIIGSGIIGSAVARELSRYQADILVLDKENDIACGTTKANSGIVHAGYDPKPGSLKAKYNILGNKMFDEFAKELDFPFKRNGALVLALDKDSEAILKELYEKGVKNGVEGLEIISGDEAREMEPNISPNVTEALYAPTAATVSPYEMSIAYAENAATNGVKFRLNAEVEKLEKTEKGIRVCLKGGETLEAKLVINCAGVFADDLSNQLSERKFSIVPRRGEYLLLDKIYTNYTKMTLFQTPTKMGKGVLVTPATHGNIIVGPNAQDIDDKSDLSTTISGLKEVWEKAKRTLPSLNQKAIITNFTGIRAHSLEDDFIIGFTDVKGLYNVAGIESPGLTAAPAIAVDVAKEVAAAMNFKEKENFIKERKAIPHFAGMSEVEKAAIIKENPLYGKIVCRCEVVPEGEIREAIRRPLGARDLDALKRRTRVGMGRCQGGFCLPRLMEILSEELNVDYTEITKSGRNSKIVVGKVKE
jgi:glycerol-3-phosphate dehydrogenase